MRAWRLLGLCASLFGALAASGGQPGPATPSAWLDEAAAALADGEDDKARGALAKAAARALTDEELIGLHTLYQGLGDYCLSIIPPAELRRRFPRSPAQWVNSADGAAWCDKRAEALADLAQAQALKPLDKELLDNVVHIYIHLEDWPNALKASDDFVARFPDDLWHWLRRADAAVNGGRREAAAQALARAEGLLAGAAAPACGAALLLDKGAGLREREVIRLSIAGKPGLDAPSKEIKARARRAAAGCLAQAEAAAPETAQALVGLALLYRQLGDEQASLRVLKKAARLHPDDAAGWIELADTAVRIGDAELAARCLASARRLGPLGRRPSLRLAALYRRLGDYAGALELLAPIAAGGPADAAFWLEQGETALLAGNTDLAAASLRRAQARASGDSRLSAALASAYRRLGEPARALALLDAAAGDRSSDATFWLERAQTARATGQAPAAAFEALRRAEGLAEGDSGLWTRIAEVYRELGEPARALAPLEKAVDRDPASARLRLDQADAALAAGKTALAEEALRRAESLVVDRESLIRIAVMHRKLKDFAGALARFEKIVPKPRTAAFWIEQADTAMQAGHAGLASSSAQRAEELSHGDPAERLRIAMAYLRLGDAARALSLLEKIARSGPRDASFWLKHADAALKAGGSEAALRSLSKAEDLAAGDRAVLLRVAARYRGLKHYDRALALLAKLGPGSGGAELWMEQAKAAGAAGKKELALRALDRAAQASSERATLHELALLYQDLGERSRTLAHLETLIKRYPQDAAYLKDRGICEFQDGAVEKAVRSLESAIALDPRSPESRISLAAVYTSQRRYAEALVLYDQSLSLTKADDALRERILKSRDELNRGGGAATPARRRR